MRTKELESTKIVQEMIAEMQIARQNYFASKGADQTKDFERKELSK